jgi:hypothetical protein
VAKKSKAKKNHKKFTPKVPSGKLDRGFDFGLLIRTMAVPDFEFNQSLRDAGIIGCAYGFHPVDGLSHPVPCITLIGTNIAAFERAHQAFQRWGCEEDGDVLDVELLLKSDGSYNIWIGPEINHLLYRTIPQASLFETLAMNFSWVKTLDSTHEMVRQFKLYCESKIHPVVISAGIGNPSNPSSLNITPVPGWKNILKFGLRIIEQSEAPDDFRFAPIREQSSPKHEKIKSPTPEVLCQRRTKTLDIAFPVSRERVRSSSLLHDIRCLPGFEKVTETQVVQAAINLMLSGDLVPGDKHYRQVTGEVEKTIWHSIASRVELADGTSKPADQNPTLVARQIELDVRTTLKQMKARGLPEHFPQLQEVFLREGYVND